MAAVLASRRMLLLTAPTPISLIPSAASSTQNSSSGPTAVVPLRASSSSAAAAVASNAARDHDTKQARISWRPVSLSSSSSSSSFHSRVLLPSSAHQIPHFLLLRVHAFSSLVSQGLQTSEGHTVVADAEAPRAARQVWKTHTIVSNPVRSFGSISSKPKPRKRSEPFGFMATGGSAESGGFATSSVLTETVNARGAENTRGDPHKLVTFESTDGQIAVGVIRGDAIWALQDVLKSRDGQTLPEFGDMESVIKNWGDLRDRLIVAGSGTQVSEVKLLAPIPRPAGVIMCIGKNYLDHVKEVDTWKTSPNITKPEAPKHPIVFTKAPQSVIGPGAAIKYPHGVSTAVDYEAELGVIIGKPGQSIKREDAMSHVFGYTIINDVTARDLQKRHQQWFLGKSCDTFCPMGPAIVPASEIDGNDLRIQCWVNDELRQDGRSSQMLFGIPQLIEVISAAITLQPGDIIATGTPAGVGSGFNPPRHLTPGDKIRIHIEGIGELCNVVE